MSVRLYVGNLSYRLTAEELSAACSALAEVQSVYLPTDRETGRPRGFGFVEVADEAQADRLISALSGVPLLGRPVVVHPARPREIHPARPRDGHASHLTRGPHRRHGRYGPDRR